MEFNLLQLMFTSFALCTLFFGLLINIFENYLPSLILHAMRYGKFAYKGPGRKSLRVPKSWFRHFYVFSAIWSTAALLFLCAVYFNCIEIIPSFLSSFLSAFRGAIEPNVPPSVSFIAMVLLSIQCYKRFYETHFVSVFSDSTMDVAHYIIGLAHYFGAVLAIVCQTPLVNDEGKYFQFSFSDLSVWHTVAALVFLWASKAQLDCAKILGNLRKNKTGAIVTKKYQIPQGGYFALVSSPHNFCEIAMYLSLWMLLWGNPVWPSVVAWVIINQVETALLTHWWYIENFKNYPRERKALIPYIL